MGEITYNHIKIECGIQVLNIEKLVIEEEFNEHVKAYLVFETSDKEGERAIKCLGKDSEIKIKAYKNHSSAVNDETEAEGILICKGTPMHIRIKFNGAYKIEMQLSGKTHQLDIDKKNRSFQDVEDTFESIFNKIIVAENKGGLHLWSRESEKIQTLFIQYEETDWEFLQRLTSKLNLPIYEAVNEEICALHIGIIKGGTSQIAIKGIIKGSDYEVFNQDAQYNPTIAFVDTDYYRLGATVSIDHLDYIIIRKETSYIDSEIQYKYYGKIASNINRNPIYNEKLIGAGINATMIERKKSKAKLHLSFDEEQDKAKAYWFDLETPYAAGGKIGWYLNADEGESVILNFTDKEEQSGRVRFITHSDSDSNDKLQDGAVKYFAGAGDSEMKFDSTSLTITGSEGIDITMTDNEGIKINSSEKIKIESYQNLTFKGKNITLEASDNIKMATQQGSIIVDDTMHLKATQGVWSNGEPAQKTN